MEAAGSTTVLYSGDINETPAWRIVKEMGEDVRRIDKTMAAEVLSSDDFKAKVAQAFGLGADAGALDLPNENAIAAKLWLNKGGTGPWAVASEMFVEATTGKVKILTLGPADNSVLWNNELPTLLDKLRDSTDITEIDGIARADLLKIGAAYSTGWMDAMRDTLVSTALTQTHFSAPSVDNYTSWLHLTPEELNSLHQNTSAAGISQWHDLLSHFEVPPAATKAQIGRASCRERV